MSVYALLNAASQAGLTLLPGGRDLMRELDERVARIPVSLNSYGFDPWGYNPDVFKAFLRPTATLYRYWFRCQVQGIANVATAAS